MSSDFVHLRVHTAYSLSEGAIHVKELVKQCVGHKMPAVAMTDTDNMFAALEFSVNAADAGVQPILGVTLSTDIPECLKDRKGKSVVTRAPLVLLAQSELGYQNLMKIVSKAHLTSDPQTGVALPLSEMEGISDDIICLTGGADGALGQLIRGGKEQSEIEAHIAQLEGLFGGRLYVELQRHGRDEEIETEEAFLDLAYERDLPIVATNQPYFVSPDMYEAHDVLLCIADSTYVTETQRRKLNKDWRMKTAEDMVTLFKDLPEAIENTINIARRCSWRVKPIDPLLPNFTEGLDVSEADMLRQESEDGLDARLALKADQEGLSRGRDQEWEKPYWDRLTHELKIINQMGFPGYFLIVADFIQWAKDQDIPVGPGRGSGAGSAVAWALKITDLDPLRFSLLFERFLNPERVSMPDFDIDFCQDRREEVIRYVQDKYGHDKVAQIITFGKLQARAVVKACGRALQQPYPVTDRLSKLIPNDPGNAMSLAEALEAEPRLREARETDELTDIVIDRALKLEGLYAHSSTHAAGVVIGDRPLDALVPLYRDPKSDMPVTQFNMKWVELAGLVKFDFLGLKTLTVLQRAVENTKISRDVDIVLETLPFDDPPSYELLASGNTAGVFQLESTGMRKTLKGLKPDTFEDIIAIVALYRPGPMDNIPTYVDRKHGREEVSYPHPMLEDILEETNGIIVYQEQVMQIAQVLSGYSLGEADLLRRAMGKKIAAEMDKQRGRFIEGSAKNDISEAKANEIFDLVAKFASYGFNKSHAAAYALVAYHTAYMKANYPAEFMAAIMTLDLHNTDKLGDFRSELKRMGIPVLLPDINQSETLFTVEPAPEPYCEDAVDPRANFAVRYALGAIKGVGEKAIETIIEERRAAGPFKDLYDFADRVDPKLLNKRQLEQLAAAGAFDSLMPDRARAYGAAEMLLRMAQKANEERTSAQVSLFGEATGAEIEKLPIPPARAWTDTEALDLERKSVGFYLSAHPLDTYEKVLRRERIVPAVEVFRDKSLVGQTVTMAGAIIRYREGTSKASGRKFGSLMLSDQSDSFEIMIFSDDLESTRALVEDGTPLLLTVQIRAGRDDDDDVRLSNRGMVSLDRIAANSAKGLLIEMKPQTDQKAFESLKAILGRKSGGQGRVTVIVQVSEGKHQAELVLNERYMVTPELRQAIAADPAVLDVQEL